MGWLVRKPATWSSRLDRIEVECEETAEELARRYYEARLKRTLVTYTPVGGTALSIEPGMVITVRKDP